MGTPYTISSNNMAGPSDVFADSRVASDLGASSDDDDFVSSASTASAGSDTRPLGKDREATVVLLNNHQPTALSTESPSDGAGQDNGNECVVTPGVKEEVRTPVEIQHLSTPPKRPLHLLDLPMDILQVIMKEVCIHTPCRVLPVGCNS